MLKGIELRDYQKRILEELKYVPAIGLFIKTGGGKTITSLARFFENDTNNLLVICPQKVITQWWEVIEKYTDIKPCKYSLSSTAKAKNNAIENYCLDDFRTYKCVVINYDILDKIDIDNFINDDWTIILDECFDKDTEILTDTGFKYFKDLTYSDKVAQYDKYNGEISFVTPLDIIKRKYEGKLVSIHNTTKTINTTPNHIHLVEYKKRGIEEVYAKDLKPCQYKKILLSGKASGHKDLTYLERLYIAINADGCITYKGKNHYRIRMCLSKERKINRIKYLLDKCKIPYMLGKERIFRNKNWKNSTQIYFSIPCIDIKNLSSFVSLSDISYNYCLDFIDELSNWDCHIDKYHIEYDTTNKQDFDIVQAIVSLSNMSSTSIIIDKKHTSHKKIYRLYIYNGNKQDLQQFHKDYIDYNDYVYCVKVPTKAIVVRRNGYVFISGNCHKIKSMGTYRKPVKATKRCLELGELTPYKIILTATPTEKNNGGYIDLYSQLRFLGYINYNETYFKNNFCIFDTLQLPGMPFPIKKIVGYRTDRIESELKPILNATCRYYSPKYGDYEPEMIKISIDKAKNYNKLIRERVYNEIVFDNVSAMRIGKKSLIGGVITGTNEYGDRFTYDDNNEKVEWLEEFLSGTDEVVSILYCYNVERDKIIKTCKKLKKKYIVIDGTIKDKPAELKKNFDVVIGQYQAFSESLDGLQYKCHLMIFYSMPDSSLSYKQSLGRIDRIGQTKVPTYYHLIMKGTIDENIYDMIQNKIDFSEKELNDLSLREEEI